MAIALSNPKFFLGAFIPNVKVLSSKVDEIITSINNFISGNNLSVPGNLSVTGTTTVGNIAAYWVAIKGPSVAETAATGGAITAAKLLTGYVDITGATGSVALPSAADITTALGSSPKGTSFDFIINAKGMTAANVVTLTVGANTSVPATPIITGSGTLTVAQDAQVVGKFTAIYDSATTIKLFRVA